MNNLAKIAELGLLVDEDIGEENARADLFLRLASGIVRDYLEQQVSLVEDDVVELDPGDVVAFLPQFPIVEVSLVEITYDGTTWTTIDPAQYRVNKHTGSITNVGHWAGWATGPSSWRVTYTHGWAADAIPDTIVNAVLGLASRSWELPIGVENERVGQRSIKYLMLDAGFLPTELIALDKYKVGKH